MAQIWNNIKESILTFEDFKKEVLEDYKLACISRSFSLIGRREVLMGKAKFGIFGAGKEIAQIAMAKAFKEGDFRAGYYRDQTFMLATGMATMQQLLAQLYANPSLEADPHSAGRQMNNHFSTRSLNAEGTWKVLKHLKNSAADNSPTANQMLRALGLASASKKYRSLKEEIGNTAFSNNGNEVCFATIGDASTSEGIFWEVMNAAGVLQVPLVVSIWDDGYGISVPKELQTVKGSISKALSGFQRTETDKGFDIYTLKGWDYPTLVRAYKQAIEMVRKNHIPAIFHIEELTQPQGHSTSGSHERYKSVERLQWEKDYDCLAKMKEWIVERNIASEEDLLTLESEAKQEVVAAKKDAWKAYHHPIKAELESVIKMCRALIREGGDKMVIGEIIIELEETIDPTRKDVIKAAEKALRISHFDNTNASEELTKWLIEQHSINKERYNTYLFTNTSKSALKIPKVKVEYPLKPKYLSGYQVLNACFKANFERDASILAFGEDVGNIGGVNQAFAGLQQQFGEARIYDTGIREATIIGEGIGLAMRGWRPIAEIQYLDYLMYGLMPLVDDLSTLSYRTKGGQKAPLIVRTRGHRLEGIWHAGSPIGMIVNALRGMHICVPRNMTQAAGFYNALLRSDEPALVIECLNGYRLKEAIPSNPGSFTVPLGVPEILTDGRDVTLVTYGSCVRIAQEAIGFFEELDISIELIDIQTLLPFDIHHIIVESIKKTGRLVLLDEDVPGGGTAYMMQQIVEKQQAFKYLDAPPITISAKEHRTAYGSDGDYFCKPNAEDVFKVIYSIMNEINPDYYPDLPT